MLKKIDIKMELISVEVETLKIKGFIDIKGDTISYENLSESIKTYDIQVPIFIDSDNTIISGNRRIHIAKKLGIENVAAYVVDKDTSEIEIEKLKIDFSLTQRNMSYLDNVQIYCHQQSVFEKYNEPYTEYMSKLMNCTQRAIQLKVQIGKAYKGAPEELKDILQTLDREKKITLKTLKLFTSLKEKDLENFYNDILDIEDIIHKDIVSITAQYTEMVNRKNRNKKINEALQKSKDSKEDKLTSEELNEINSVGNTSEGNDSRTLIDIKKVFQYEIKKHFKVEIDSDEERDVKVIKSQIDINFREEIELITSLLKGDK